MPNVSSSVIHSVDYNEQTKTLVIKFVSGSTYRYKHVPEEYYLGFLSASSKGQFFNDYIKDRFPYY